MAVRTDKVQLEIAFITDESKQMAAAIRDTQRYQAEINKADKAVREANKELQKANITIAQRTAAETKLAAAEKTVSDNLKKIAESGAGVAGLDLSRVVPQQLIDRAKALEQTLRRIPQSAPEYAKLKSELTDITGKLRELRQTPPAGGGGGFLNGILGGLGRFAPQIAVAAAAWEGFKSSIAGANKLEQLTISFETFLGSAEKAKEVIGQLKDFEAKTPFEAEQVNQAGRALLAFGFSTEELIPTLRAVGDVASGTGKDFNELALIYGKAKAQGLIQGEELNQLAEAGIPIYAELGKVLGVSEGRIRKLGEEGKIQFSDLEKVFKGLTSEGGRFSGLMEKQSQSIGGLYSTLKSQLSGLLTQFGTSFTPIIKGVLSTLITLGNFMGTVLTPVFKAIGVVTEGIVQGFTFLKDTTVAYFQLFSLENIQGFVSNFGLIGQAVGSLIGKFRAAREEERRVAQQEDARARAENARDDRQLSPAERQAIRDKEAIRAKEAAAAAAEAAEKEEAKQKKAADRAEKAFQKKIAAQELAQAQEELLRQARFVTGKDSEEEYQAALSEIQELGLLQRLALYEQFGRLETQAAIDIQRQLLDIAAARNQRAQGGGALAPVATLGVPTAVTSTDNTTNRLQVAGAGQGAAQAALRQKFEQNIILEGEYNLRALELKRAFVEEELAILRSASEQDVAEVKKREEEKADLTLKIQEQKIENETKLEEVRKRTNEASVGAFQAGIELGIELLGKDAAARKRHAGIIKAFEIGQVVTQGITEVQKIFQKNAALPGGNLLSALESIPAAARTTAAIVKISRQKFAGGGDTGPGLFPPDSTGERPAGIVHAKEYVVPRWMRNIPGVRDALGWMEGIRLRGYAQGGLVTANTTPGRDVLSSIGGGSAGQSAAMLEQAAAMIYAAAMNFPKEVKSRVVYTELEAVGDTLGQVRDEAAI
jgi:tape measure domain-containing protein